MIPRASPRTVPEDNPVYIEVELAKGTHHLRIPSTIAGARAMGALPKDLIDTVREVDPAAGLTEILQLARSAGPQALSLAGHVVGVAWHHRTLDLESVQRAKEDPLVHGERVFEELYEAGYSLDEILSLAFVVATEWLTRNGRAAEALKRADFFAPTRGGMTSLPSTSASTSSGTRGDSTN